MVFPDPNRHTRELMAGDHAEYIVRTEDPLYPPAGDRMEVQAVAVAPDGAVAIALSGRGVVKGSTRQRIWLLLSSDDGQHWTILRELSADRVLSMTAGSSGDLAVVTERQVIRRRGSTWTEQSGPPGPPMQAASVVPGDGGATTVYALTETAWSGTGVSGGVFVSEDGGAAWRQALAGLADRIVDAGVGSHRRTFAPCQHLRAMARRRTSASKGCDSGRARQACTTASLAPIDSGRTWQIVHRESNQPSPTMTGSWLEERAVMPGPDIWFDAPYDLGVSPRDADLVYVTDLFRTYRTLDGGGHWAQVHSQPVGPRTVDHTGPRRHHRLRRPRRPARSRSACSSATPTSACSEARTAGGHGSVSSQGMPQDWRNTTYWVAFDPGRSGAHVGRLQRHPRSAAPEDVARRAIRPRYRGGVGLSRDGGRTWSPAPGLPAGAVTHVLVDPREPGRRRARCTPACSGAACSRAATTATRGALKNEGLAGPQPFAWRLTALGDRQAVPGRCAAQRERPHRRRRAMARSTSPTMAPSTGRRSRCRPARTARPAC